MTLSVRVYWTNAGDKVLAEVDGEETYDVSDIVEPFDTSAEIIRNVGTFLEEQGYTIHTSTVWDIEEE